LSSPKSFLEYQYMTLFNIYRVDRPKGASLNVTFDVGNPRFTLEAIYSGTSVVGVYDLGMSYTEITDAVASLWTHCRTDRSSRREAAFGEN